MSNNNELSARLANLSPAQREALLKKLRAKKQQNPKSGNTINALERSEDHYRLSFAQQRLWFLQQLEADRADSSAAFYNIAAAIRLRGNLHVEALRQALGVIVQRHEALRTTFFQHGDESFQRIHKPGTWVLPMEDFSKMSVLEQQQNTEKRIRQEAGQAFDLANGPLLRTTLLRLHKDEHILLVTMHHIVSDGWSTGILIKEMSALYGAFKANQPNPLADLKLQYIDYAHWQREKLQGDALESQLTYWRKQLQRMPVLEMPIDYARPPVQTYNGAHHHFVLSQSQLEELRKISLNNETTLFTTLLTAFKVLLSRYSQQHDICVGTPVANRNHRDLEPIIGCFVNTLALRTSLRDDPNFLTLLKRVEKTNIDAQSHQDLPFERLVEELVQERDPSHTPIFQSFFSIRDGREEQQLQLPDLGVEFIDAEIDASKFDLSLICTEYDDHIACALEYNTDLYHPATIQRIARHFSNLVQCIINNPELPLSQLELLDSEERRQLLRSWNETTVDYPQACVQQLFERQVARTPDNIAIVHGSQRLSYRELNERANQLAHYLRSQGLASGTRIGVCFPHSNDVMVAILGILKAGAAYIPMDPNYPSDRLSHMAENAEIRLLLTNRRLQEYLPIKADHCKVVALETLPLAEQSRENPDCRNLADDMLYVVYTSGSTGNPKGAAVRHRNEVNLLHWYTNEYGLGESDKVLVISALGFDLTQKNLFAPLVSGAQLVFPSSQQYDPVTIRNTIEKSGITLVNCAPSAFYPLAMETEHHTQLSSLRWVLFGGEPIRMKDLIGWLQAPECNATLVNMYGPTECTDIAATHKITDPQRYMDRNPPIGRPNSNVQLFVLDPDNQPVPIGVVGELCIGGDGVGMGYLNNPDTTAEKFFDNPFGQGKLYRTGDLVRYRHNGLLEFVSRIDDQVKIRGFRIELGEVEAQLAEHPAVKQAVVAPITTDTGSTVLAAYCTTETAQLPLHELRSMLKQKLPEYMVPSAIVSVDYIPLSPNGKIDRKALPGIDLQAANSNKYVAPRSNTEKELVNIWQALLKLDKVGIHDNFFEIGGHSLLATQLVSRIRESMGVELPLRTLFEVNTIAEIAEILSTLQQSSNIDYANDQNEMDDDDFEEGVL